MITKDGRSVQPVVLALAFPFIIVFGNGDCGQLGCRETVTELRKPSIAAGLRGTGFYPSEVGPNGRTEEMVDGNGRLIRFKQREEALTRD